MQLEDGYSAPGPLQRTFNLCKTAVSQSRLDPAGGTFCFVCSLGTGRDNKRNNATGPGAVGTCAQIKHLTCKGVLLYVDRPPEAINQIRAFLCV